MAGVMRENGAGVKGDERRVRAPTAGSGREGLLPAAALGQVASDPGFRAADRLPPDLCKFRALTLYGAHGPLPIGHAGMEPGRRGGGGVRGP